MIDLTESQIERLMELCVQELNLVRSKQKLFENYVEIIGDDMPYDEALENALFRGKYAQSEQEWRGLFEKLRELKKR